MLVTDAMPSVGAAEKSFRLQGRVISFTDGVLTAEDGTLAGSDADMATMVRNAVGMLGVDLSEAARMASRYPAEFLGLGGELGRIAPGYRANLVLVDDGVNVQADLDRRPGAPMTALVLTNALIPRGVKFSLLVALAAAQRLSFAISMLRIRCAASGARGPCAPRRCSGR